VLWWYNNRPLDPCFGVPISVAGAVFGSLNRCIGIMWLQTCRGRFVPVTSKERNSDNNLWVHNETT
jgi:hypothetical protein